jgi:hypothetical protein
MERRHPPGLSGRIPLAVIVVDGAGLVSHWSTGARRLFGRTREEAIGRTAVDLLPVGGALDTGGPDSGAGGGGAAGGAYPPDDMLGPDLESSLSGASSYPTAGRARLYDRIDVPGPRDGDAQAVRSAQRTGLDVLWWAYPLVGPGPERLLVLAADAAAAAAGSDPSERIAPGFALHTEFPGSDQLAKRLPEILPSMNPLESARIVAQVLELGYPVLEISQHDRVPVTPDWGVPRRAERQARQRAAEAAAAAGREPVPAAEAAPDLEYAAVREASPTDRPMSRPCGIASRSSTPTNRAAGTTWCRSASPCRFPRRPRSSSA